jgi:hypothetical protein
MGLDVDKARSDREPPGVDGFARRLRDAADRGNAAARNRQIASREGKLRGEGAIMSARIF